MPRITALTSRQLTVSGVYSLPQPTPQYLALNLNKTTYNEGETITATVNTANIPNGTTVNYAVTGISSGDLSAGSISGTITINANTGSAQFTLSNDGLTEGADTFIMTLSSTDSIGTNTGTLGVAAVILDTSNNPNTTLWLDSNDQPTTVRSIIGGFSMQINGVFASNPSVPIAIQGRTSGNQTTITAITARTGTYIEVDDTGNSTNFIINEQLNRVTLTVYTTPADYVAGGASSWTGTTLTITTSSNNSLAAALRSVATGRKLWITYDGTTTSVVTLTSAFSEGTPDPGTGYISFTAAVSQSASGFRQLSGAVYILPLGT